MSNSKIGKKSPNKSPKGKGKAILYNDKCSKLEVALNYNGRTETIFIDNKENISSIRDMVYNIFYPIQGKFQLIYKLKDISPFEDIPLYKYFKNLMKISITINLLNTQILLDRNDYNKFNNSIQDVTAIDKNEASFSPANQSQISNPQNPLIEKDRLICNECHNKLISNFCRNCNLFLCKNCSEKYSSLHHDHPLVSINVSQIEKSAKNYKELVSKFCFMTGKKYDEYRVIFKDFIDESDKSKDNLNNTNKNNFETIKEKDEENINENNDLNNNLESINNMINNGDNSEIKNEINNENNNKEEENNKKEIDNKENNNGNSNLNGSKNNKNGNNNIQEKKIKEKKNIDDWLNGINSKIEILSENISKNEEANNPGSSIKLREQENNYEYISKQLQKINAEKNKKDLETIFKEMYDIDLDIKKLDRELDQSLNNSSNNKITSKDLKDLNKNLDNIINKLVKNLDIKEIVSEK